MNLEEVNIKINSKKIQRNSLTFMLMPSFTKLRTSYFSLLTAYCLLFTAYSHSQVTKTVDTTKIRVGEQIEYKINVKTDSTTLVVFPEGQTFTPLEMVESSRIDTTIAEGHYFLEKKYALTKFDSGAYFIPKQKVVLGDKVIFIDSLKVEVNTIEIDTTKQGLYDIKPLIEVEKNSSKWWLYLLLTLVILGLIAFLLYWFIWRQKPLTEEEEIALLPPYDRAKIAIKKLDESQYLIRDEIKGYYSELTFIIRRYLDEKVYNRALESTTSELIDRLELLSEGNEIKLSKESIKNIEDILRRADLVKFAKSAPDTALAEIDKNTIDKEIDQVKAGLPEPTEEEKLLDKQYREKQERKKKRQKIWLTVGICVFLALATLVGFGFKIGFKELKDNIIGHESKELLDGKWVKSAYGFPPVWIDTPKVLKRVNLDTLLGNNPNIKMTSFMYGTMLDEFSVGVNNTVFKVPQGQNAQQENQQNKPKIDLNQVSEGSIKGMEQQGATDIVVKRDKFSTPNGAEGLKTYGTLNAENPISKKKSQLNYTMLHFTSENVLQQVIITTPTEDEYADKVLQRILDSIELKPDTENNVE